MSPRRKILYFASAFAFLVFFFLWQIFFWKNTLGLKFFPQPILPQGFCKDCNVILISLDTLRAKSLPCYGYGKNTAPNLCGFALKSYLFKNSFSTSSKTLDSHFSIFTSLYPISHRMVTPFTSKLSNEITTLPEVLKKNGYQTIFGSLTSDPNLPIDTGLERGFDKIINSNSVGKWKEILEQNTEPNRKFLAFLHTYQVHEPYMPSSENIGRFYDGDKKIDLNWTDQCMSAYNNLKSLYPEIFTKLSVVSSKSDICDKIWTYGDKYASSLTYEEHLLFYKAIYDSYWNSFVSLDLDEKSKLITSLYESEIYETDLKLGEFFEYLKSSRMLENTIVVLTADHGEEFFEHNAKTHGYNLYNESLKVPLIIYVPRANPIIVENLTSSIDIMPSVLYLLNLDWPKKISGLSLFSQDKHDYILAQHSLDKKLSLIGEDWKIIINNDVPEQSKRKELYNLKNDLYERNNLVNDYPDVVNKLEKIMKEKLANQSLFEQIRTQPFPTWIDENQRKKLIETGYF